MASVKSKAEEAVKTGPPSETESVYTTQELVDSYRAFNTYREIVAVALRQAGKQSMTFREAKNIIERFKNKEVK